MAAPWLSVVMPVHGGARDLPATLASAAAEKPEGVEFLIYDSSMDSACGEIAKAYADWIAIRYVAMPEIRGWPEKTNRAVAEAAAPHVAMLHQDDLWLPGHLDAARKAIAAAPSAAMSVAPSRFIDANDRDVGPWSTPFAAGTLSGRAFGQGLIVQNFLAIPSPVIRRDIWLETGGMDDSLWYTADWDLYLKLSARGDVVVRPQATTGFRIHGNSLTMTGSRDTNALRQQLEIVVERHGELFGLADDRRRHARALASIDINCGLAKGAAKQERWMKPTLSRFLKLGPVDAWRYMHESRIADRTLSRLRARVSGAL
ncbi:MAG: glycosyltransferase [Sphingobium sp.]|nr:glycosyltransferase [Sphingobium sp.]